jgi:hypothetical protein
MTIRYEDLVTTPEATVQSVCAFLGTEYSSDMLEQRTVRPQDIAKRKGWAKEHFASVLAPVSTANVDTWRQRMTAEQIAIVEYFCGTALLDAGYEPTQPRATRLSLAEAWTRRQTMRVRRRLKRVFHAPSGPVSDQEPGIGS